MASSLTVQLPAFTPDQTAVSGGLLVCNNVYPKTDGYGPLSGFTGFSAALGATFKGGQSFIATDGTSYMLVGTDTGLLKYAGASWTVLTAAMVVTEHWRFAQFGNYAIGVNGYATKVVNLATSVSTTLAGAPVGKAIAVVDPYVVIAQNTGDLTGIYTSGVNDHTKWDVATTTATFQPMLSGGEIMGLAGGEYGVILQRGRLVRMTRTGSSTVPFAYDEISTSIGCASKGSVAQHGNRVFFLDDSGFKCLIAGQEPVLHIGSEKIDRTFIAEVAREDWSKIYSAIDPQSKVVIWCLPGTPGKLWIYNWELDKWTTATLATDGVFSGFTSSTDLETLAITYPNLDAMTISLDDPRWAGGNPLLYVVQTATVGTFYGLALEATFGFSFSAFGGGKFARLISARPITDAVAGLTLKLDSRARLGDAESVTTYTTLRTSGIMPVRCSGRYVKSSLTYAAGTTWSYLTAVEYELEVGGER